MTKNYYKEWQRKCFLVKRNEKKKRPEKKYENKENSNSWRIFLHPQSHLGVGLLRVIYIIWLVVFKRYLFSFFLSTLYTYIYLKWNTILWVCWVYTWYFLLSLKIFLLFFTYTFFTLSNIYNQTPTLISVWIIWKARKVCICCCENIGIQSICANTNKIVMSCTCTIENAEITCIFHHPLLLNLHHVDIYNTYIENV